MFVIVKKEWMISKARDIPRQAFAFSAAQPKCRLEILLSAV